MKNELELIDDYFNEKLTSEAKSDFEKQLLTDNVLAKDIAFYLQAKKLGNLDKKNRFLDLHQSMSKSETKVISFKNIKIFSAAASILLIFAFIFLFNNQNSSLEYADNYIDNQLIRIETEMSTSKTSISDAIEFYNQKKYKEAQQAFATLPESPEVLEYKGLTYLQTKEYNAAQKAFHQLAQDKNILQNKGAFLEAITLLKLNKNAEAEQILKSMSETENNYFGKKEAKELLNLLK